MAASSPAGGSETPEALKPPAATLAAVRRKALHRQAARLRASLLATPTPTVPTSTDPKRFVVTSSGLAPIVPSPVALNPPASVPEGLEHAVVYCDIDAKVYRCLRKVGDKHGLSTDTQIADFLLQRYHVTNQMYCLINL